MQATRPRPPAGRIPAGPTPHRTAADPRDAALRHCWGCGSPVDRCLCAPRMADPGAGAKHCWGCGRRTDACRCARRMAGGPEDGTDATGRRRRRRWR